MLAIVAFAAGRYHVFRWGGSPLRVAEAAWVRGEGVLIGSKEGGALRLLLLTNPKSVLSEFFARSRGYGT